MNTPSLSIIVPVYNAAPYLPRCLDSLLGQQFRDFELICVNDGSTDGSLTLLERYAAQDSRMRILSQHNQGLSVTRNRGLAVARGEYVGFCDSDDSVDLDFFAKLMAAVRTHAADIAMAGTKVNATDASTQPPGVRETLAERIAALPNGAVWDKVYRMDLIRNHALHFPPGLFWEDNAFQVRAVFHARRMVVIDDTFYHYYENPQSIRREVNDAKELKRNIDVIHVSQQMLAFAHEHGFDEAAMLELQRFIWRTLPWPDIFANPRIFARLAKLEDDVEPRDQVCKLFGRIPILTIQNRRGRATWRLFGRLPLLKIEDIRK